MQLDRVKDDIFVFRKNLLNKDKLDGELQQSTRELKACEAEMRLLERAVEDPTNPDRINYLKGDDPSRDQLDGKLNKVQVRYKGN